MHNLAPSVGSEVRALLGPTNTGKTHTCTAQMLEHESGMFGLPLRLLAREVYDRVCREVGPDRVALVTGEERRVPSAPRYWICTVEAMPVSVEVEFLAVDEVQLMTHPIRGHVFTERVLHARGTRETWFLGSASVRGLLQHLVPTARFTTQARFSELTFTGNASLGRVPPRSALVAFSASEVYELAERVRVRRGGAAVVLGALSPRTRNAQVQLYQAGEVDYLVATDAIGMGLNMSIDHVALAGLTKFDGKASRALSISELAQVAGRAGRYLKNGSFGTLDPGPRLNLALAERIQTHRIPIESHAWWRNSALDFGSLPALRASLTQKPKIACLRLVVGAEDGLALELACNKPQVKQYATTSERIQLLWDVCQIPDYRRLLPEVHNELVVSIYEQLIQNDGKLDDAWLSARIERLDDVSGDIDALLGRISFVRTWTYVVNHRNWLSRSRYFRERTAALEDALSDALHQRLLQRFVERRRRSASAKTAPLLAAAGSVQKPSAQKPSAQKPRALNRRDHATVAPTGHPFAELGPMRDALEQQQAQQRLTETYGLARDQAAEVFSLSSQGVLCKGTTPIARLLPGRSLLRPELRALSSESELPTRRIQERQARDYLTQLLEQLFPFEDAENAGSAALRGIWYHLREGLGTARKSDVATLIATLTPEQTQQLRSRNVILGHAYIFQKALLKPHVMRLRVVLASTFYGEKQLPFHVDPRRVSLERAQEYVERACLSIGYAWVGPRLVRVDALERFLAETVRNSSERSVRKLSARRACELLACRQHEVGALLSACAALVEVDGLAHGRGSSETEARPDSAQPVSPGARSAAAESL